MPNLISRVVGLPEASSGRRPQMCEFQGLNWSSPQAQGLVAFFPFWEPPGVPCLDLGPYQIVGQPNNILRSQDLQFGDVYAGDGNGSGSTPVRGYKIPYHPALDFGLGPTSFSVAFWMAMLPGAVSPAVDYYVFAFDTGVSPFPGYAFSVDSSKQVSFNTANSTSANATAKTVFNPFAAPGWHHYMFTHVAGPALSLTATQYNYVDGALDSSFGACVTVGSVANLNPFYFGTDDDGLTGQFGGWFFDLRLYNRPLGPADAAMLWHPDTRWDIYQPARKSFYVPVAVAAGAPFVASDPYVVRQAVNRGAFY